MSSSSLDRYSPAAAIQPYHRPAIRKIDAFVLSLGGGNEQKGRERFLACLLLTAHSDDRLDQLLQWTEDPALSARSVGDLAICAGFRAGELIKVLKETALLVGQAQALHVVAEHLPAVVQDLVTRAQNHYETCASCEGSGKITPDPTEAKPNPGPEPCKPCKGRGQVFVSADADRQDRVLEIARLLPESKGTQIGIVNNAAGGREGAIPASSMGQLFTQLVAATDRIVHPDRSRAGHAAPPAAHAEPAAGSSSGSSSDSDLAPLAPIAPVDGVVVESSPETMPLDHPAPPGPPAP